LENIISGSEIYTIKKIIHFR